MKTSFMEAYPYHKYFRAHFYTLELTFYNRMHTQDLHPNKNWSLYERLTGKAECSVDQRQVESDGKPGLGMGEEGDRLAALISSVVTNASLMVQQGRYSMPKCGFECLI